MNQQAKDILTILRACGYYDEELTANLLSVVDKKAGVDYLRKLDRKLKERRNKKPQEKI